MFESKSGVLLIGGLGFFLFAFLSNGIVPMLMYKELPEKTAEQLVAENENVMRQFSDLKTRYPESFEQYFGEADEENCVAALRLGRQVYIGEGCWHCHSQFVRPVSNESRRWGMVSETYEYQNELQRPVMFGTRRVGPDLSREGGRRSNDWHAVHFFRPKMVSSDSPMPEYPWLFDGAPDKPNRRGLALITYVQWLGSWLDSYPYYEELDELNLDN
ncbi:MAG: cbb3-type cytochrome c oxidase subunit II [Pirellulaceae bacterium]